MSLRVSTPTTTGLTNGSIHLVAAILLGLHPKGRQRRGFFFPARSREILQLCPKPTNPQKLALGRSGPPREFNARFSPSKGHPRKPRPNELPSDNRGHQQTDKELL
jgi:hypothetical protein